MEIQRLMLERKSNKSWKMMVTLFVGNAEKVPRKLKENSVTILWKIFAVEDIKFRPSKTHFPSKLHPAANFTLHPQ
jgi:hypothetical protein